MVDTLWQKLLVVFLVIKGQMKLRFSSRDGISLPENKKFMFLDNGFVITYKLNSRHSIPETEISPKCATHFWFMNDIIILNDYNVSE